MNTKVILSLKDCLYNHPEDISHFDDWIYLGYSYIDYLKLEKDFGRSKIMESFHRRISQKAEELRGIYTQYISKISQHNQSIYWHISETAENNTMCNNLFLDFCYLNICLDILKTNTKSVLFVIDSKSLLRAISKELKSSNQQKVLIIPRKSSLYNFIDSTWNMISHVRGIVGFLKKIIFKRLTIRLHKEIFSLENHFSNDNVLVYTFANDSCFQSDGTYKERYFGELIPRLKRSGKKIIYLLHTTGYSKEKYRDVVKWINISHDSIILLEELITIKDVFISLLAPYLLLQTIFPLKEENKVLFSLLKSGLINECISGGLRTYYLYYTLIRNLYKNDLNIKYLLDIYEGHIIERVLRFSVRKHIPQCKTIGFSHSAFSKNHLSFFTSLTVPHTGLKPDYLLCTGCSYKNIFINAGFNKKNVTVVGNLRQEFSEEWNYDPIFHSKRNSILVALPLLLNDAQELLWKIIKAFRDIEINISIYKHPMMSFESLGILESKLPDNIEFKNEPTNLGLQKSNLLITTGSNMSVNALKIGMPVISMVRSVGLSFEPLDWFNSPITYCSLPDEIFSNSKRLLSQSSEDYNHYSTSANTLAKECLEPVNSIEIERFIKQLRK